MEALATFDSGGHRSVAAGSPFGLDVLPFSRPARAFSGDFYRWRALDGGTFFAIGDVKGKGLDAAVVTAMIQEVLDAWEPYLDGGEALHTLLLDIDAMLQRETAPSCFATAAFGRVDAHGEMQILNAGHCPPILLEVGGGTRRIPSHGPPLGLLPGLSWEIGSEHLAPGETLCLYTDGVMEATSNNDEEYGIERLEAVLAGLGSSALDRVASGLVADLRHHTGSAEPEDDLTLLLLRRGLRVVA
ncbi:MAG: PP2C family protein-serine/threonine phosphatase [Thermoanaerobaculia bacterium]|nr:PP2C family protein-serine/threonine phosphatase [Thermoanaerobaculia bacterium]